MRISLAIGVMSSSANLCLSIPVIVAIGAFLYLHRRTVRRQRMEDAKDYSMDLDFGLDGSGKKKRRTALFGGEKGAHKINQLSMDMNLSSPYLLPPALQGSHESIHSLAKSFPNEQDPYRLVPLYSDSGSMRSLTPGGMNSTRNSAMTGRSVGTSRLPPPRINSLPRPPIDSSRSSVDGDAERITQPAHPAAVHSPSDRSIVDESEFPALPSLPAHDSIAYPDDSRASTGFEMPDVQQPAATFPKRGSSRLSSPRGTAQYHQSPPLDDHAIGSAFGSSGQFQLPPLPEQPATGLGLDLDLPKPMSPTLGQADEFHFGVAEPAHPPNHHDYEGQPQIQTSEYYDDYYEDDNAGQHAYGQGEHESSQEQHGALGVPQGDTRRHSVGFRPLPPEDVMDIEDPEYRANRIRSFYREYFDDSKEAGDAPPVPGQHYDDQYYEDYDQNYLGDAAYYDADSNAFVMPYAQPVTRRAMTPPPGGRPRGPMGPGRGGRGGPRIPHGPHGSVGGVSLPGGPGRRGRGYGPRSASAMGPRPGTSASKKKGPPPMALHTLPPPSKLKDDSFALMNAIDFAPPDSFKEHQAGRSQSPFGERRPYSPSLPAASPLVTSYDELTVLPSP